MTAEEVRRTIRLSPGVSAPALGRAFLAEHAQALPSDILDDALIMVSELITNAVTHGQPAITLTVRSAPPAVGVAVTDHGPDVPPASIRPAGPSATHGRGLNLIDALADQWGVTPTPPPPGKTVWFEIAQH